MFLQNLIENPGYYISWVLVVMFSICMHELCHALAARQQGDMTGSLTGYVTLDPTKTMGYQSIIMLLLFGIAWGAVPVDPRQFRHRWSEAWVALAGPLSNLVLAVLFAAAWIVLVWFHGKELTEGYGKGLSEFYTLGVRANSLLTVFNLLPLPMLDGWRICELVAPPLRRLTVQQRNLYSFIAFMAIMFSPLRHVFYHAVTVLGNGLLYGGLWVLTKLVGPE